MRLLDVALTVLLAPLPLLGCQLVVSSATTRLADDVSAAVLAQDDPGLVRDGGPAYLIAVDGLIQGSPENEALLLAGARLYASYASAFVEDPVRAQRLTSRAKGYGQQAVCLRRESLCDVVHGQFDDFERELATTDHGDLPALYGFGSAWAAWVQANSSDWGAIADLPKVQALMERVVELDDRYEDGSAHLYLGVLYTLRPESLGGKPEEGRRHFEQAVEYSNGRNLTAKVLFASQYARLVFDRELHDRLLREVLDAEPHAPGFTLSNTLAQEQARVLLDDADEYF